MERKVSPQTDTIIIDEDQGIVDHLFSVYGVIDEGLDRVHPGAFLKTVRERGASIKVLDTHNSSSVMSVLGKPLEFYEISREQLPPKVRERYPEATGGMVARVQYFLDTEEGRGAFLRIKNGGLTESSFAYDVIRKDYTEEKRGEKTVRVRELRELKLYDVSPVVYGMNPATAVLGAKSQEQKDWRVVRENGQYCVYRAEGDSVVGDPLHCYDREEEAMDYLRALYANMPEDETAAKAVWTTEYINDLPDSAFLYIEPGHEKDETGRTVPRSARHFPYRNAEGEIDLPHLRNAIARIPQSNAPGLDEDKKRELQERARRLLEQAQGKAAVDEILGRLENMQKQLERIAAEMENLRKANGAEPGQKAPPTPDKRKEELLEQIRAMLGG